MTEATRLPFDALNAALKAAGEDTRLRVLVLLSEAELTVSDLTQILRQSQPRISRHLRLLVEAGLIERFREGAWAFFRMAEQGGGAELARTLIARLDPKDPIIARDRDRLAAVRAQRAAAAQDYFRAHAAQWDRIRKLHVPDEAVEQAIRDALADKPFRSLLDLGTGTGRILEMFGTTLERGLGIDLSLDMLLLARARIERAGLAPLQRAAGRHLRSRGAGGLVRRGHHPSGAALPRRRRPRDPRGRARAGAAADACWWSTSRRTIWNSCARSMRTAGSASPRRRWRNG